MNDILTLTMEGMEPVTVPIRDDQRRWSAVVDALDLLGDFDGLAVAVEWPQEWGDFGKWTAPEGRASVYLPDEPQGHRFNGTWVVWSQAQREALENGDDMRRRRVEAAKAWAVRVDGHIEWHRTQAEYAAHDPFDRNYYTKCADWWEALRRRGYFSLRNV